MTSNSELPAALKQPSTLGDTLKSRDLAMRADPLTGSLPDELIRSPEVVPPLLHYGFAVPYDKLVQFASQEQPQLLQHSDDGEMLDVDTAKVVTEWLVESQFKGTLKYCRITHPQFLCVWSLYTNYECNLKPKGDMEERIEKWIGDDAKAMWYIDSEHYYWSAASRAVVQQSRGQALE